MRIAMFNGTRTRVASESFAFALVKLNDTNNANAKMNEELLLNITLPFKPANTSPEIVVY
jgi:hypothetical protein